MAIPSKAEIRQDLSEVDGVGTVTWQVGSAAQQTASAAVALYSADGSVFVLSSTWTDPAYGPVTLFVMVENFNGTGSYDGSTTPMEVDVDAVSGQWGNGEPALIPGVSVNLILTEGNGVISVQGSVRIEQLAWCHVPETADQPPLNVSLSGIAAQI